MRLKKLIRWGVVSVAVALLLVGGTYYGLRVWIYRQMNKPLPAGCCDVGWIPETVRVEDTVYKSLLQFTQPFTPGKANSPKDFPELCYPDQQDVFAHWDVCGDLLDKNKSSLTAYLSWSRSEKGLERPNDLGKHRRMPNDYERPPIEYAPIARVGRFLALDALSNFRNGRDQEGISSLTELFRLANYLHQNPPSLVQSRIAIILYRIGIQTTVHHLSGKQLANFPLGIIPTPAEMRNNQKIALGGEWIYVLADDKEHSKWKWSSGKSFSDLAGFFLMSDPIQTKQDIANTFRYLQERLDGEKLGDRILAKEEPCTKQNEEKAEKLKHSSKNDTSEFASVMLGFGRCSIPSQWIKYVSDLGKVMDQVEALKIILSARQFHSKHRRWPATIKELGYYEATWPLSKLNGQPLQWDMKENAIIVPSFRGDEKCEKGESDCVFLFSPKFSQ